MKSVALYLPILAACYGATPSKPVRNSLPPPIEDLEVISTASDADEFLSSAQVHLPSWASSPTAEAAPDEPAMPATERRRMPSMISRSAGAIATKRVATGALWAASRPSALQTR